MDRRCLSPPHYCMSISVQWKAVSADDSDSMSDEGWAGRNNVLGGPARANWSAPKRSSSKTSSLLPKTVAAGVESSPYPNSFCFPSAEGACKLKNYSNKQTMDHGIFKTYEIIAYR